jgi:transcriptional regulator with XRE-family HTH domain
LQADHYFEDDKMTTRPSPRRPNLELRRARQAMRLSQAQFADAIRAAGNAMGVPNHCTKRLVQKWETGEHAGCRPDYLRVLQAVTGLSARELGFRVLPDESGVSSAASEDQPSVAYGDSSGCGKAADTVAHALAASPDLPLDAIRSLRHTLDHPSAVDSRTAELVETATARLFDLEHHSPARLLTPTVDRHLYTVTAMLTAARHEAVRRRLMLNAGRSALLAGWLAFDRGDIASAHRFWEEAISTAQGIAEQGLFAAGLIHQSYAAARHADPATAWQLAHTASSRTPEDPRATAWITSRIALHAAQLGEREAAEAAMGRSLALGSDLPTPKPGDGGHPWARFFSRAVLLASTAHTAALLKDARAIDYATKAVEALSADRVKAHAVVLAEAALTAAIVGELELCLDYGSSAAALTRDLEVSTASDLLYEAVPLLLPYSDTRHVRELLPQLTRLTRTTDLRRDFEQMECETE